MSDIMQLQKLVDASRNIVFFGGAGVSTESGIPDFRSTDGLYNQKYSEPPETILSHSYFLRDPEGFFKFYFDKMIYPDARPGAAHKKLAEMEAAKKLRAVVTQNIDGLHEAAGSRNVFLLHGSVARNYCMRCGKFFSLSQLPRGGVPHCECGGIIKPDVVLYEEPLNEKVISGAAEAIAAADLLIVGGTSLGVYPAAGLINYFSGSGGIVLINKSATPLDRSAAMVIRRSIGEVLGAIEV